MDAFGQPQGKVFADDDWVGRLRNIVQMKVMAMAATVSLEDTVSVVASRLMYRLRKQKKWRFQTCPYLHIQPRDGQRT